MIVTFHVAIYLVYQFFENYIYPIFTSDAEETETSDDTNGLANPNVNSQSTQDIVKDPGKINRNVAPRNEQVSNQNQTSDKSTKGVQDSVECNNIASVYDEDQGYKYIYDVESKFECYDDPERGIKFVPPVYIQRYVTIEQILKQACWENSLKKVVDFGCAELSFELRMKKLLGIQEIISVDIDYDLLERNVCKISPSATEYLSPRPTSLRWQVFCGSVGCTNEVVKGADAVIAIELIEHLFPDDLDRLPFTVFAYINPLIAIFTTPNSEFNVLFKNLVGFRHDDHKFEWTRHQFQDWGNNLVQRYPEYTVTYQGVGPGVPGTEHLGCCSQMAIFVKVHQGKPFTDHEYHVQDGEYKLIREEIYPHDTRTRSEIIRDDAIFFINRVKSLSKHYDNHRVKEIPLKDIMERVKCYSREKLTGLLKKEHWIVSTNTDGHYVVEIPESDEESNHSSIFSDKDKELDQIKDESFCYNFSPPGECWDSENGSIYSTHDICLDSSDNFNNLTENSDVCCAPDCLYIPNLDSTENITAKGLNCSTPLVKCDKIEPQVETVESVNSCVSDCLYIPNLDYTDSTAIKGLNCSTPSVKCDKIAPQVDTVDSGNTSHRLISPSSDSTPINNADCSVYETPCNTIQKGCLSKCEQRFPSVQSLNNDQTSNHRICKKSISFETSDFVHKDSSSHEITFCDSFSQSMTNSFCCVNSSSCDISTYATPYCPNSQKKNLPKSLSLQQVNSDSGCFSVGCERNLFSRDDITKQKDGFSRSVEGFKSQESCDILDTLSTPSKVVDSGYPDSYSDHNMDLDLTTPEQFEDIETESKSSLSSRSVSPILLPVHPIAHMIDNVENGDVANNNRDGEGNNMVADMEEEPLEFEAQIEEMNNEIPNMDAIDPEIKRLPRSSKSAQEQYVNSNEAQSENNPFLKRESWLILPANQNNNSDTQDNIVTTSKHMVRSTKSDLSIATSSSWSHLDSSESQSSYYLQDVGKKACDKPKHCTIKAYNSLTTVLDGCSKFSECSIVHPFLQNDILESNNTNEDRFPKWLLNIDYSIFGSGGDEGSLRKKYSTTFSLQDGLSVSSVYQSAGSLNSLNFEEVEFPQWLLNIQSSDNEDEINQDFNEESFDDVSALLYNVQVDVRGGGDPQREVWF